MTTWRTLRVSAINWTEDKYSMAMIYNWNLKKKKKLNLESGKVVARG